MSSTGVSTGVQPPSGLLEALYASLLQLLGGSPTMSYLVFAVGSYAAAAFLALQVRGALRKEWASIGDWRDRIVVVVSSTATDQVSEIERYLHGAMAMMKGRVLITWPDATAQPLTLVNRSLLTVVQWGGWWDRATAALTSGIAFFTMAIIECAIAGLLWTVDAPRMGVPNYVPQNQSWLFAIFLWPVALYLLQHVCLPDWRAQLDAAEADMKRLSRQFPFMSVRLQATQ